MKYILQNLASILCKLLKTWSLSIVRILTLNWTDINYRQVTMDVCRITNILQQKGTVVYTCMLTGHLNAVLLSVMKLLTDLSRELRQGSKFTFRHTCPAGQMLLKIQSHSGPASPE